MDNINKTSFIAMIIMAILSFSNLIGLKIAGISVIVGVVFCFVIEAYEKQASVNNGLDVRMIRTNFKDRSIWLWFVLPQIMDAVSITISKLFVPDYREFFSTLY